MNVSFGPRRKARTIGQDTSDGDGQDSSSPGSAVKRPARSKYRSRVSFGPSGTSMADEEEEGSVITPKRGLARRALEKSAAQRVKPTITQSSSRDAVEGSAEAVQPSYSKEYLAELKSAQKSRPDGESQTKPEAASREIDVAAKFGKELAAFEQRDQNSIIPTDAEIQEKKARRARLAKLEKYNIDPEASENSDEPDDRPGSDEDEFLTQRDKISLRDSRATSKKEVDTRLVRDDEDLMEGFEEFTGANNRVALGNNAQSEARAQRRAEMRDLIDAAQEADEDDEDDSDRERRDDYEAAQTRKGIESLQVNEKRREETDEGARTPPRITPIPPLEECVQRLREKMLEMEADRKVKLQRLEQLEVERKEINVREADIQRLLAETAAKYEKLSSEAGTGLEVTNGNQVPALLPGRGLEDMGIPEPLPPES